MAKNFIYFSILIFFLFCSKNLRASDFNQIIQNQKQLDDKLEVDRELVEEVDKKIQDKSPLVKKEDDFLARKECNIVNQIKFDNILVITNSQKLEINKKFTKDCFTKYDAKLLKAYIQRELENKGFTKSYPRFNFTLLEKKILIIEINKHYIESIKLSTNNIVDSSVVAKFKLALAFGYLKNDSEFNLEKIEMGIKNFNSLASNKASYEVIAGRDDDHSIIVVKNYTNKHHKILLNYDNFGNLIFNKNRINTGIRIDNLFKINDSFNFSSTINQTALVQSKFLPYISNPSDEDKYNLVSAVDFTIPIDNYQMGYSFQKQDYQYQSNKGLENGFVVNHKISLRDNLFNTNDYRLILRSSIRLREIKNRINYQILQNNSFNSSFISLGLSQIIKLKDGELFLKPTFIKSFDKINATNDSKYLQLNQEHKNFDLFEIYGDYQQKIKFGKILSTLANKDSILNSDLKLNYNLAINGQFVKRKIANADKISIGGVSSVRGFNNSSISGDIGYFIRNDLTINLSDLRNEEFYKNLELGVFYDYGAVRNIGYRSGRLSSVGLTFNSKPKIIVKKFDKLQFNSQLSLAKTLTDSKLESNNNKYAVYYRLGLEI